MKIKALNIRKISRILMFISSRVLVFFKSSFLLLKVYLNFGAAMKAVPQSLFAGHSSHINGHIRV